MLHHRHFHIFLIASVLSIGLISSCGEGKKSYDIDSLIEDYAYEEGTEFVELHVMRPDGRDSSGEEPQNLTEEAVADTVDSEADGYSDEAETEIKDEKPVQRIRTRNLGRLREVFNDSNYRQLVYAQSLGIAPIRSLSAAYHTRRPIVHVKSNRDYTVDTLTHSLPYLVPEAERLLRDIGRNFQDSLKKRGDARYRVRATSLLRTPATVKRLRRVNINATDSSTHQFGTTFDLSYHRFHNLNPAVEVSTEDLKNVLAEVLYDLREQGRCLVKFERKTGCFHVTVTH